jgi:hypothetical protein
MPHQINTSPSMVRDAAKHSTVARNSPLILQLRAKEKIMRIYPIVSIHGITIDHQTESPNFVKSILFHCISFMQPSLKHRKEKTPFSKTLTGTATSEVDGRKEVEAKGAAKEEAAGQAGHPVRLSSLQP